nr:DWNN domain-containing protein [Tanacetum cinerariifolium]
MRMNDGAPTTSREESKACKSESRLKHELKRGVQRESSKDLKSRKVSTTHPRASSKRRSSSRGDEYDDRYRHHKRHRSER